MRKGLFGSQFDDTVHMVKNPGQQELEAADHIPATGGRMWDAGTQFTFLFVYGMMHSQVRWIFPPQLNLAISSRTYIEAILILISYRYVRGGMPPR